MEDVLNIDSDMADPEHDCTTIGFNAKLAALLELMVKTKQSVARRVEMSCVLKDVKAYQVVAKE